jgi:cell division protein ZipA
MSELRWILVGFGIVLLAGIYLWGRRGNNAADAADEEVARTRSEPPLHARDALGARSQSEPAFDAEPPNPTSSRFDESRVMAESMITAVRPATRIADAARRVAPVEPPTEDIDATRAATTQEAWRSRVEPTFSDQTATEEMPVESEPSPGAAAAPTLSSSETPAPRRIERRKILALRLAAAPQRLEGAKLLEMLQAESLQHGKYSVFHRLHDDGVSIFSIASMVEPGTFDLEKMPQTQFPGITLFAQLPGPVPGMHALNELVACARRLQQGLGGTLQDDRGVPLTVHRVERLRQEVREFERPPSAGGRGGTSAHSLNP